MPVGRRGVISDVNEALEWLRAREGSFISRSAHDRRVQRRGATVALPQYLLIKPGELGVYETIDMEPEVLEALSQLGFLENVKEGRWVLNAEGQKR